LTELREGNVTIPGGMGLGEKMQESTGRIAKKNLITPKKKGRGQWVDEREG